MRAIKDHEAYLLLGGRLNLLENSSDTIKREIEEELGLILEYKLISIEENIVESTKFQMLEFVYYAEIDSFDLINSLDDGWDKFKIFDHAVNDTDTGRRGLDAAFRHYPLGHRALLRGAGQQPSG